MARTKKEEESATKVLLSGSPVKKADISVGTENPAAANRSRKGMSFATFIHWPPEHERSFVPRRRTPQLTCRGRLENLRAAESRDRGPGQVQRLDTHEGSRLRRWRGHPAAS